MAEPASVAATTADLLRRDRIDSGRATAPLSLAPGAVHIDTTDDTLEEVVDRVLALVDAVQTSQAPT
jgi:cytidylate kinase